MDKEFVEQKLKDITDKIVKEYQPEKIILFGSWAWGNPGPDSDVDLLVVKRTAKSRSDRERELNGLLFPRVFPIDVLVYTPDELERSINENRNLFLEDVVRNGRVLYDAKPDSQLTLRHKPAELVLWQSTFPIGSLGLMTI